MSRKPSPRQLEALKLVAQGRIQYGAEYPDMARRLAKRGDVTLPAFLIDGCPAYGSQRMTWATLEERGWIIVRHDLVPSHTVAEQVRTYRSITGVVSNKLLPAHQEPIDPGWRARVELTDAGQDTLRGSAGQRGA